MLRTLSLLVALAAGTASAQPTLFSPVPARGADLSPRQQAIVDVLRSEPGTAEIQIVRADDALLRAGATVTVALPDGGEVLLATRGTERRQAYDRSWHGADVRTTGPGAASASFVVRGGWLTGTVWASGEVYSVRPLTGGLHAIARQDLSGFRDHGDGYAAFEAEQAREAAERARRQRPLAPEANKGPSTTIDVLVAYTSEVAAAYADPVAYAQSAVDAANVSYANSGVPQTIALVHAFETTTASSGSTATDLPDLAGTSDGNFDEVHTLRDAYGADMVALLGPDATTYGSCGRGYINSNAASAFSVTAYNCAVGNLSFAHELGHNMGARHNPENDPSTAPYAYGHGKYVDPVGGEDSWRTVMSYQDCASGACTRLQQWSNPDVTVRGTASGDAAERDNARVLEERAASIAAFRPTGTPPSLVYGPGAVSATLSAGQTTSESVSLQNTAGSGAQPLSWTASIQNETTPALTGRTARGPAARAASGAIEATPVEAWDARARGPQPDATKVTDCVDGGTYEQDSGSTTLALATGGTEYGQSFTAACTGRIEKLAIVIDYGAAPNEAWTATVRFFEGEGTGGTALGASSYGWTNASSGVTYLTLTLGSPIDIVDGQTYTWFFDMTSGSSATWVNPSDPDAGGALYTAADGSPGSAAAVAGSDARYVLTLLAPLTPSIQWVSLPSGSGSVAPEASGAVAVDFDATGLADGTYTADLVLSTNDPANATVTIPLSLTVGAPAGSASITGSAGWYFLSAPDMGATVDDLAAMNLVAGVPGYYPTYGGATLLTGYDGSAWSASGGAGQALMPGHGFLWYFWDQAFTPTEPTTNASSAVAFPVTLSPMAPLAGTDVSVTLHASGNRFNMLGNPFGTDLDVSNVQSWDGGGKVASKGRVYTWDATTGAWTFPATTIAPWQGFAVRAKRNVAGSDLTIPAPLAGITSETLPTDEPRLAFELEGTDAASGRVLLDRAATLAFERDAAIGADNLDAEKLQPLAPAFVSIGLQAGDALRAYEARPLNAPSFEVPLVLQTAGAAESLTLRWAAPEAFPADWAVRLVDRVTGETVDMRSTTEYAFSAPSAPRLDMGGAVPDLAPQLVRTSARFSLLVDTGREASPEDAVRLAPAAPNPARGAASLTFTLAEAQPVVLEVVDLLGRTVQTVREGPAEAGTYTERVRLSGLASGVYVVRLRAGEAVRIQRLTVVR